MKYKLINKTTSEEHLCEKVVVDGWDYYVSDEKRNLNDFVLLDNRIKELPDYDGYHIIQLLDENLLKSADNLNCKKVIATNNPNIDIPKVVEEVERLAREFATKPINSLSPNGTITCSLSLNGFEQGYNKSQETHPNSDDDMIEFNEWCNKNYEFDNRCNHWFHGNGYYTSKELLQLWKEQRTKILYYE